MRQECRYLIDLHHVGRAILLFHGPAIPGPPGAVCADYRRKLPFASVEVLRKHQDEDAHDLAKTSLEWAGQAAVELYRCEVSEDGTPTFIQLD
jgi:hypothetical protein